MPDVPQASSGRSRVVQPDVAAPVQVAGHRHVVVRQEHDAVAHAGSSAKRTICWISALPPSSAGCDLPATTSWIGRSRVQQQAREPLAVAQHQRQPLVGRHPAGETDGQHVRVEHRVGPAQLQRRRAALQPGRPHPPAHLVDQRARAAGSAASQQHRVGRAVVPAPARVDLAGGPRGAVHAVGDRADRHLVGVESRPQAAEHLPGDRAVQLGHAVGALGQPQAHVRHVEQCPGSPRRPAPAIRSIGTRRAAGGRRRSSGCTRSTGNRSIPAGTGVCVVNTVPARTADSACVEVQPLSVTSSRIRSRPRKPACPSLVWNTSGRG